jgi:hypothetical protein
VPVAVDAVRVAAEALLVTAEVVLVVAVPVAAEAVPVAAEAVPVAAEAVLVTAEVVLVVAVEAVPVAVPVAAEAVPVAAEAVLVTVEVVLVTVEVAGCCADELSPAGPETTGFCAAEAGRAKIRRRMNATAQPPQAYTNTRRVSASSLPVEGIAASLSTRRQPRQVVCDPATTRSARPLGRLPARRPTRSMLTWEDCRFPALAVAAVRIQKRSEIMTII